MITSTFFVFRIALAWFLVFVFVTVTLAETVFRHNPVDESIVVLVGFIRFCSGIHRPSGR